MRILLKWIASTIFMNSFWVIEYCLFFFPTSLIKIWVGIWIMMPQYYGEYAVFNILSDYLENFELLMRNIRDWLANSLVRFSIGMAQRSLKLIKYIPNDDLMECKENIMKMQMKIKREENLR